MWKSMDLYLIKNHLWKCLDSLSFLNWTGTFTLFLLLELPPKNWDLIFSMKFFSSEITLDPCMSIIQPCMEYSCQVWVDVASYYLDMLNNLQKWICWLLVLHLLLLLNPWPIAEMQPAKVFSIDMNWLKWFRFFVPVGGQLMILMCCMIFLSSFLYIIRMSVSTVSFFAN